MSKETHVFLSTVQGRAGQPCTPVRVLGADEVSAPWVGQVLMVRFADGEQMRAYSDELERARPAAKQPCTTGA